ncbi:MAG TPA: hypothetical protein VN912_04535 [Candidatus Angelobacter sp.]|nr:hypothetical protein [Candidatus Angelobacter sp.]
MDSDQKPPQAFMTALTTEHFALQGARSTLTAESASRAALYLASLTGSLIALGFVTRDATVLGPFAVAVLPALLILGEFTYWRLVNAGVEDFHYRWEIQRIRAYYRGFVPPGLTFFADAAVQDSAAPVRRFMGVRARDLNVFLTIASMVAAINSILAGASLALGLHAVANLSAGWAVGLAALIAAVLFLAHMRIAIRQYRVGLADLN